MVGRTVHASLVLLALSSVTACREDEEASEATVDRSAEGEEVELSLVVREDGRVVAEPTMLLFLGEDVRLPVVPGPIHVTVGTKDLGEHGEVYVVHLVRAGEAGFNTFVLVQEEQMAAVEFTGPDGDLRLEVVVARPIPLLAATERRGEGP